MRTFTKRQRLITGLVAVLVVGGLAVVLSGYGPEIGRFFAYEQPSGYVPFCVAYGQRTVSNVGCCAGLTPISAPSNYNLTFCLSPGCQVHDDGTFACPSGGPMPGTGPGDADNDGDVDIFDYNIVVTNFGRRQ